MNCYAHCGKQGDFPKGEKTWKYFALPIHYNVLIIEHIQMKLLLPLRFMAALLST